MSERTVSGLARAVGDALGATVAAVAPVTGGCISEAARVDLGDGSTVFAKSGAGLPTGLLDVEAEGLRWLGAVDGVPVPEVLACTDDVLVLEWLPPGPPGPGTDDALGRALAALHGAGEARFGWHRDGFIGREPQRNTPPGDDWADFWTGRRISPLVERAVTAGALAPRARALVDRLRDALADRAGPAPTPVRVHGDLWSGNVHVDAAGRPWLVDPAPYAGHPEVDLAMLHLFGRPGERVTDAYAEVRPLAGGWRRRLDLWQLEPLLNHAVMFGGGYGDAALGVLDRWS